MEVYCNVSGFPHKNWNQSCEQVINDLAELQGKDKVIDLCAQKISDTTKTEQASRVGNTGCRNVLGSAHALRSGVLGPETGHPDSGFLVVFLSPSRLLPG
jgi:hypothetical protein